MCGYPPARALAELLALTDLAGQHPVVAISAPRTVVTQVGHLVQMANATLVSFDHGVAMRYRRADRVLSVGGLRRPLHPSHLVRARSMLRRDGFAVFVDFKREPGCCDGPPSAELFSAGEAAAALSAVGFSAGVVDAGFDCHFAVRAIDHSADVPLSPHARL